MNEVDFRNWLAKSDKSKLVEIRTDKKLSLKDFNIF